LGLLFVLLAYEAW